MAEKEAAENPWETKSSKFVYENPWIHLTEYEVVNPSGNDGIYGVVRFKNKAIGIIPIDEDDNTWLVGQYRYPLEDYSWEIPEGGGPVGEPPLEGAKRELEEETGLTAENWQLIQELHLSNSVTDEHAYIYVATGLRMGAAHPDDTEELRLRKVPFEEALRMTLDGEITDSMSVAGILKLALLRRTGRI